MKILFLDNLFTRWVQRAPCLIEHIENRKFKWKDIKPQNKSHFWNVFFSSSMGNGHMDMPIAPLDKRVFEWA